MGKHTARTAYSVAAAAGAVLIASITLLAPWEYPGTASTTIRDDGVDSLAFLTLYAAGLVDDGARSRLPAEVQRAMGGEPFEFMTGLCSTVFCGGNYRIRGWDHESYLRSVGGDLVDACGEAYDRFVEGHARMAQGAFQKDYMGLCTSSWSTQVLDRMLENMLDVMMPDRCGDSLGAGWFINAIGEVEPASPPSVSGSWPLFACLGLNDSPYPPFVTLQNSPLDELNLLHQ